MNNKNAFRTEFALYKYGNATLNIGLWESEKQLINKYFKNKDGHLLDIGCGAGRTSFALEKLSYKNIKAIDISPEMIGLCNELKKSFKSKINFAIHDISKQKYKENSFDYILFSFNGFPGIPDYKSRLNALKLINKYLKKDGVFIFTAHAFNKEKYEARRMFENINETNEFKYQRYGDLLFRNENNEVDFLHLYSHSELENELINNNFTIIDVINRDKNFKENSLVKEFSDNTNFWICSKKIS
ncbi:class I SAM-dependent methyltransferase [Mycoplasmopsis felis]|uniref:class I SAM-dependent methyltransferase n=1 Tax=Mycoplasmopsis felis TaxID=33923 RepID=UPI002B002865|nr:class I SAM-dependent methyltransferase [Mycoplasmopsis felis]WQQ03109.1 class I SAM-dependent methyltransferase [Mycoplasmopsis felis]